MQFLSIFTGLLAAVAASPSPVTVPPSVAVFLVGVVGLTVFGVFVLFRFD